MSIPDTIIFLHIPKTAGTTLNQILQRQYEPQQSFFMGANAQASIKTFKELPAEEKAAIRLAAGHTAFGFHNYLPGSTTYFTFMREPVERVISFYHYVRSSEQHYLNHAVVNDFSGIAQFVSSGITKMVDNGQTRMISGTWLEPGYGEIDSEIFEQAKANLHQYFGVVGLTEAFDTTLLLLQDSFNWQNVNYVRHNVTTVARVERLLSAEDRDIVTSFNQWDSALYKHAQEMFLNKIAAMGSDFPEQLEKFKQQNARYQTWKAPLLQTVQKMKNFSIRTIIKKALSR